MSFQKVRLVFFLVVAIMAARQDYQRLKVSRSPLLFLMAFLVLFPSGPDEWRFRFPESFAGCVGGAFAFQAARTITAKKLGLADVWMAGCIGGLGGPLLVLRATLAAVVLMLPSIPGKPAPFLPALLAGTAFSVFSALFFGHNSFFF